MLFAFKGELENWPKTRYSNEVRIELTQYTYISFTNFKCFGDNQENQSNIIYINEILIIFKDQYMYNMYI